MNTKKQRTVARRCVTSSITHARTIINNEEAREQRSQLKGIAALLGTKRVTLEELDTHIILHSEEDDDEVLDREVAETTSYQTEIFTCLDEIERALSNLHVQGSHRTRSSSRTSSPESIRSISRANSPPNRDQVSVRSLSHTNPPTPTVHEEQPSIAHSSRNNFPLYGELDQRRPTGNILQPPEPNHHHYYSPAPSYQAESVAGSVLSHPSYRAAGSVAGSFGLSQPEIPAPHHPAPVYHHRHHRLPKLEMDKFDGNPSEYQSFMDCFESSVNSDPRLNAIDKFMYLKSFLKGRALSTVQGLSLTNENYANALRLLKSRYGDQKMLKATFFGAIHKLKCVSDDSSVDELRELYDTIESNVRNLQSMGVHSDMFAPAIIPTILTKIPESIRREVSKVTRENDWNFDKVLETINDELVAREQCKMLTGSQDRDRSDSRRRGGGGGGNRDISTASSLYASSREPQPKKSFQFHCVYCKKTHKEWQCDKIVDVAKRREILQTEKRCFNCLRKNCSVATCKSPHTCHTCKGKHHSSIHPAPGAPPAPVAAETDLIAPETEEEEDCVVLLKTVIAPVSADDEESSETSNARLILDDGSQRTYISRALSNKLGLKVVNSKSVILNGICGKSTVVKAPIVIFYVRTLAGKNVKIKARVLDTICEPISEPSVRSTVKNYPHLRNIRFSDYHNGTDIAIDILIGGDHYYDFVQGEEKRGPPGTPVAIETTLGWTVGGPDSKSLSKVDHSNLATISSLQISETEIEYPENCDERAEEGLKKFWDLDTVGIREDEKSVCEQFVDQIEYDAANKEYEVRLPFKPMQKQLPSNFNNACRRAHSELARLKRNDPETLNQYHEIIQQQLQSGKIEKVDEVVEDSESSKNREIPAGSIQNLTIKNRETPAGSAQISMAKNQISNFENPTYPAQKLENEKRQKSVPISINRGKHYLLHHGVKRTTSETTKLRIVYNGSYKRTKDEPSLNESMYKGPSLVPLLFSVLVQFRLFPVGFICDITKAFLQIRVAEEDRDYLRFIWFEDPLANDPIPVIYRFAYVLFGLNCSPFLLNATLRHHLMKYSEQNLEEVMKILRSLYVDDFTGGTHTTEQAASLYLLLKQILEEGGFPVHKFVTNDPNLRRMFNEDPESVMKSIVKVLGVTWNTVTDQLLVNFSEVIDVIETATKRVVAKILMKIFDPLGLVTPVILFAKLILRDAWQIGGGWDTPLPEELQIRWRNWCESLQNSPNFEIPRCYIKEDVVDYQLMGFCDGSTQAFAAAVYLRAEYVSGQISSQLVSSKTRVAPTKITVKHDETDDDEDPTIPRLELLSCFILSNLMQTISSAVTKEISISKKQFWTDSTISLHRIRNTNTEYKQFVENRLVKIRKRSEIQEWYYVPTDLNPADLPSRGCLAHELVGNQMWIHGPEFLCEREFDHRSFELNLKTRPAEGSDPELKSKERKTENAFVAVSRSATTTNMSGLIDSQRFNCLQKLLRVTAYVLRFVTRGERETGELSCAEIESARKLWIIYEQEVDASKANDEFTKTKANLGIYTDEEGVMRCKGRLSNSELPYNTKYPIYVPKRSHLANLIVLEAHDRVFHQKERATLTEIRTTYWVPQGRKLVRRLLPMCLLCRRLESLAMTLPPPPPLPRYRVEISPPFTNVGFDHMGPLWVFDIYNRSEVHKAYVALFTCATTRMVHLELQPGLDAAKCIRAMKRTFKRTGSPRKLICDNYKTFRSQELKRYTTNNSIDLKHILELSPHWGGFYERLNRIIKSALRKVLWKTKLDYEEVETLLIEIEGVLNCRPLCYVDDSDLTEPITPSHLMYGRNIQKRSILETTDSDDSTSPSDRIEHITKLQKLFWSRFSSEYLSSLRERHAQQRKKKTSSVINLGDVVMIYTKHVARNTWPLGKVTRLITSEDGEIRGVELRTESGTLRRPLNLLHPLEMSK